MADQKTMSAPRDARFITLDDDDEVDYWIEKFGVTRERLALAVRRVGHFARKVEEDLNPTGRRARPDIPIGRTPPWRADAGGRAQEEERPLSATPSYTRR